MKKPNPSGRSGLLTAGGKTAPVASPGEAGAPSASDRVPQDRTPTVDGLKASDVAGMVPPQEAEVFRLAIPLDTTRTYQNSRFGHYAQRHSEEMAVRDLVLLFWRVDRFRAVEKVRIQYYLLRGRRLDQTNASGSVKALEDALCRASRNGGEGITEDDDARYLEVECVRQIVLPQFRRSPWVIVVVKRGAE